MAGLIPLPAVLPPDVDKGPEMSALAWALFSVTTVLMCGRLYSKIVKLKRFAIDDGLMCFSWILTLCYSVAVQLSCNAGLGHHYEYLSLPSGLRVLKWLYTAQGFCIIGPAFGRAAFGFYLLAILGKAKRPFVRYPVWFFIVTASVLNVALVITIYSTCGTNMGIIGDIYTTCYRPSNMSNFTYFVGAFNTLTDAYLMLAPTIMVLAIRTSLKTKLAAIALLSLSGLAMAASIWRCVELEILFSQNWDFTYWAVNYFEAAALEMNIIIIAATIPTLGPIFKKGRKSKMSSMNSSKNRMSGDSGEIAYNLGHALGMNVPKLGNSVVITGGPAARNASEEEILPMHNLDRPEKALHVNAKTKTDITIEYMEPKSQFD